MSLCDELMADFHKMLDFRKSIGFATATYVSAVTPFVRYCEDNYPDAGHVTREMVDGWLGFHAYKTNNTRAAFISELRQFLKFINFLGKKAFIPDDDYTTSRDSYVPYLFKDEELVALFDAIDTIDSPEYQKMHRNPHRRMQRDRILPVVFRMMYCCGMRPSEPIALRCEDVDLNSGDIYIRQPKRHKDRHITMSEDMRRLCIAYDGLAGDRTFFFERHDHKPYVPDWVSGNFQRCWKWSGLEKHGNPRPYDLRHAFATRNLMRWVDEDRDVMVLLPFLSTYMGHSNLDGTLY